ncbi:hypothetical protein [Clostridium formicaceticum]|uniref:Uncharacterized protein n=1 Tax=Clostridium formicaceticum TaxID=1497 RepID=A0AAC9RFI4_9CLOT|nr:hypothetical protein [Clostridium formicaceticum]AOY75432.1 hypothetical protein BJL90_05675 [Clostridium formicaceticum]ARE85714.1 hypothetical protein CLFO_00250 [Clostridium formicaceticum]
MEKINDVDLIGQISDMKNIDYRNTLAIATLVELLIEKNIITRQEFARKAQRLDDMSLEELKQLRTRF